VAALLAAEGRVPSVHEDVAVARQRLGAERARIERVQAGLADGGLRVEEEGAGEGRVEEGAGADGSFSRLRRRLEKFIFLGP